MDNSTPICLNRGPARCLQLIDADNLVGGTRFSATTTRVVLRTYLSAVGVRSGDHAVLGIAASHAPALLGMIPAPFQMRIGRGRDGADHAIADAVDLHHAARRFDILIIASGDHFFTETALQARCLGMTVWLVSGYGVVSRDLAAVCSVQVRLPLSGVRTLALPPVPRPLPEVTQTDCDDRDTGPVHATEHLRPRRRSRGRRYPGQPGCAA